MIPFPSWINKTISFDERVYRTKASIDSSGASTVCSSSQCPNLNECFSRGFATFLLLGDICTRACSFCASSAGAPSLPEPLEPDRVLSAVKALDLSHVIITSVTRDDLPDGGAGQFVRTIEKIRAYNKDTIIEVLVPDFRGLREAIARVVSAAPDIFGHNVETVRRLYSRVRPGADYKRSLGLLRMVKDSAPDIATKSAILVGFGEEEEEIIDCMLDLKGSGCDMLAIGQYLRPSRHHIRVERFYTPTEFESFKKTACEIGFRTVTSGPFVRSSYITQEV